ncbi:2-hydroxyacid dehydrogenase [Pyramidobacter piscolens]|uniref:2-hydroxyacid dehydrogenase n=1 Tax=Pyramidobacter piscolens TaxID=638849 RepID=UPI00266657EC|nr:2-hydroxyacid dehydrogenase [Pyramidobacter piscolens]
MNKILMFGAFAPKGVEYFKEKSAGRYELAFGSTYKDLEKHNDAAYIVLRGPAMDAEHIAGLKNARMLHRWGVGYNDVDVKAAGERGIRVAITAGMNAQPVAEMATLLILAAFRHFLQHIDDAKHEKLLGSYLIADSWMINGRRVGIVGMGAIGRKLTKILQGFGAEVVYYDVFRLPEEVERELNVTFLPFKELLATSDIISLHMPLLDSTRNMIDAKAIAMMRPNALLVNTARGGIVDTDALLAAVRERRIWGAALDTVEGEPLPSDHPIFSEPHILLTPHVGGNTEDNIVNMAACIFDNIERLERGEEVVPRCLVNKQYLKA